MKLLTIIVMTVIASLPAVSQVNLKLEKYELPNGLTVVLHEDHSAPVIGVVVMYHVGSKNEKVKRTGFAHLFEHMMFQGSANVGDDQHFKLLQEIGAEINGSTNEDVTNYYEVVPSNELELALFLEADRMGNLLPAMTQEKLDNQRDVVKNERRQRVDNVPYGTAWEKISKGMYPETHPVQLAGHRVHGRSHRRADGGCEGLLQDVLRAEQRLPLDRRRLRSEGGEGDGGEIFHRLPAG